MSRDPNYADVVHGTVGRVLEQNRGGKEDLANLSERIQTGYVPAYYTQGDFTVALLLRLDNMQTVTVGVSKRNATDPQSPMRGKSLALSRAVRRLTLQLLREQTTAKLPPIELIQAANRKQAPARG